MMMPTPLMRRSFYFALVAMLFTFYISSDSSAQVQPEGYDFFGNQYYRELPPQPVGGRVIEIHSEPKTCDDIAWQAKLILDRSERWLRFRRQGIRRIQSEDLVFYQYTGQRFYIPYRQVRPEGIVFYDPFEILGYLYVLRHFKKCDSKREKALHLTWPFLNSFPPNTPRHIQFIKKVEDRFLYLESRQGYPTDIYYCSKEMSAKQIEQLTNQLHTVNRFNREEGSEPFRNYTQTRERICGESKIKS